MKKNKKTIAFFNGFYIPHLGGVERYTSKVVEILKKKYNIIIVIKYVNCITKIKRVIQFTYFCNITKVPPFFILTSFVKSDIIWQVREAYRWLLWFQKIHFKKLSKM